VVSKVLCKLLAHGWLGYLPLPDAFAAGGGGIGVACEAEDTSLGRGVTLNALKMSLQKCVRKNSGGRRKQQKITQKKN
jgi:hypothetical protein